MPRFSILHPSARPDKWRAIYDAWLAAADHPEDVEYILMVDERWGFDTRIVNLPLDRGELNRQVMNRKRRCYVDAVNLAAEHATGEILIVVADDQFPCDHWDTAILRQMALQGDERSAENVPFVLHANTGTPAEFDRRIVPMPIMSRALYERWGYVFYSGYESMYADNDLCEHAQAEGVLIDWPDSPVFPHRHAFFDTSVPMDAVYAAQNRPEAYAAGERLLRERRLNGYREVVNLPAARGKINAIYVAIPGESWRIEWLCSFMELYEYLRSRVGRVRIFPGYTSSPHVTRAALLNKMAESQAKFPADAVLWIDDDNPPDVAKVGLLLDDLEEHADLDAIGGWCWIHDGEDKPARISAGVRNTLGSFESFEHDALMAGPHDIFPVAWTGFPVFLHRWDVIAKLPERPFQLIPTDMHWSGHFGEDVSFCTRALDAGLTFAIDRRAEFTHLKVRPAGPLGRSIAGAPATPEAAVPEPALELVGVSD